METTITPVKYLTKTYFIKQNGCINLQQFFFSTVQLCVVYAYRCSLKIAINNSRNMQEWFTIYEQIQFVGNNLVGSLSEWHKLIENVLLLRLQTQVRD